MADLTILMSSDEARVYRGLQKVIDKERELAQKAAEVGQVTTRSAKQAETAIDAMGKAAQNAVKEFSDWGAAASVLRGAFQGVFEVVQKIVEKQKEAQAFVLGSAAPMEALGGLAGGDPKRMAELMAHVRRVYPVVGGQDMGGAAKLVSDVVAAGYEDAATIDYFARQNRPLGGEAGKAATAIAAIQKSMGIDETGDPEAVMAKAAIAAERAPGGVPEVLKYAAKSGGTARALGMSDEELLAAFGVVAQSASNPEMGGTQLSALITKVAGPDIRHKGDLMPFVQRIATQGVPLKSGGMSREVADIIGYLGSDDAFRAYSALALNQGDVATDRARMQGVRTVDLARAGEFDPSLRAARAAESAHAQRFLGLEGRARYDAAVDAMIDEDLEQMRKDGWNSFHRGVAEHGLTVDLPFLGRVGVPGGKDAKHWLPDAVFSGDVEERFGILPDGSTSPKWLEKQAKLLEEQTNMMRQESGGAPSPRILPGENR